MLGASRKLQAPLASCCQIPCRIQLECSFSSEPNRYRSQALVILIEPNTSAPSSTDPSFGALLPDSIYAYCQMTSHASYLCSSPVDLLYLPMCTGHFLQRACCAAAAVWLMLSTPTIALAAPEALPYQDADQTPETQKAKTAPLSQDQQSAATDSSSQLPPLPTSFPLLPDIVVQAPQEVSPV